MSLDPRTPVVVGVGQRSQRVDSGMSAHTAPAVGIAGRAAPAVMVTEDVIDRRVHRSGDGQVRLEG